MSEDAQVSVIEIPPITILHKTESKPQRSFDEQLAIAEMLFIEPPVIVKKESWQNGTRVLTYNLPRISGEPDAIVQNQDEPMADIWRRILAEETDSLLRLGNGALPKDRAIAKQLKGRAERFANELQIMQAKADRLSAQLSLGGDQQDENLSHIPGIGDVDSMPNPWRRLYELKQIQNEMHTK